MTDVERLDSDLFIKWQSRFINKGFERQENVGLDTETYHGYARLITDSLRKSLIWIPNHPKYKKKPFIDEIFEFHTRQELRNKKCFYFNLKFDWDVMMKHLGDVNKDALITLYNDNALEYKQFQIFVIPEKRIRIIKDNDYYEFYDLAQFTHLSLEKSCEFYLKPKGIAYSDKSVDSKLLDKNIGKIWNKQLPDIIDYSQMDSYKAMKIADVFFGIIRDNLGLEVKAPYSEASIAQQYTIQTNVGIDGKTSSMPTINEFIDKRQSPVKLLYYRDALRYGMMTYYAGRFEVLQRGYFDQAHEFDISSAYPAQMRNLIDVSPSKGKWEKVTELHAEAHYGYYLVEVSNYAVDISPFKASYKKFDSNLYPSYDKGILYMTKTEIDFIRKNSEVFGNADIKVIDGYEFYPSILEYPYRKQVDFLFNWKNSLVKGEDDALINMVKVLLNSPYGKTWQAINDSTGSLWNPYYATQICAGNRVKLLEFALLDPSSVISMSTDSIITEKKFPCPEKPKLGEFGVKWTDKEFISLSSGFYDYWDKNHVDEKGSPITTTKRRGLGKPKQARIRLIEFLGTMKHETKAELDEGNFRPYSMKESLHRNIFLKAGTWFNDKKVIDVNSDYKRDWDRPFKNGIDVTKNNIQSSPKVIEEKGNRGTVDHLGGK